MTNPALKDMVKIGYATDVESRRKQLSTTALPYEYEIYATYETSGKLEDKKLHKMIDNLNPDLRISKGASLAPQEIKMLLAVLPETNCQGLFNQIHKKGARSTVWLLTPRLIDYIFPFSRSLQRYA